MLSALCKLGARTRVKGAAHELKPSPSRPPVEHSLNMFKVSTTPYIRASSFAAYVVVLLICRNTAHLLIPRLGSLFQAGKTLQAFAQTLDNLASHPLLCDPTLLLSFALHCYLSAVVVISHRSQYIPFWP
jgi:hypothetical protein